MQLDTRMLSLAVAAAVVVAVERARTPPSPAAHPPALLGPTDPGASYCTGDGLDSVVTAMCPGGNFGHPGQGCSNGNMSLGGALLSATGTTSPNTVLLHCSPLPTNALATFVQCTASTPTGFVVGNGVSCVAGTLIRFGQQPSGSAGIFAVEAAAPPVSPGTTRYYQVHYRLGATPTYNVSNGYVITW